MEATRLLFSQPMSDGRPAFESQTDLANRLVSLSDSQFFGREQATVRAFISQVLKSSSEPGSRNPSPNFAQALRLAIGARAPNKAEAESLFERVIAAIHRAKDATRTVKPQDDKREFQSLIEAARSKSHVVIVTPRPAELEPGREKANELTEILIDRAIYLKEARLDPIRYEFLILGKAAAVRMRSALVHSTAKELSVSQTEAAELVERAERAGRLSISALETKQFLPPMCVFEPEDPDEQSGFVLFYHPNDTVSVAQLDQATIKDWYERFYFNLQNNDSDYVVTRVSVAAEQTDADERTSPRRRKLRALPGGGLA